MKMYFAGALGFEFNHEPLLNELHNRLLSYHYMKGNLNTRYYEKFRHHYDNIVVDSGAFSVWNRGDVIDLEKYIDYCLEHLDKVDYVVNLDVIPATPGQKMIPPEEIERSASKGYENYFRMIERGVPKEKLIHVFHQNEDFKWLERMVKEMDYIGLSPANDRTTREKIIWLEDCMPYVTDKEGHATVKFHGFAVTSFKLMKKFPWHSVDSATWGIAAGLGRVFIPRKAKVGWNFGAMSPLIFAISQVRGHTQHVTHLGKNIRKNVEEYLSELGLKLGSSRFEKRPKDYVLQEGEKSVTKKLVGTMGVEPAKWDEATVYNFGLQETEFPNGFETVSSLGLEQAGPNEKWVEVVEEYGVTNQVMLRQFLNVYYMNRFAATLSANPRFKKENKADMGF
jgi:hypothetical protein